MKTTRTSLVFKSKPAELQTKMDRKISKPIMEKKRRARINSSLDQLKSLLVEVLQKEGCRHSSKMEKADILEMTVKHLRCLQTQQTQSSEQREIYHMSKYYTGYSECLSQVSHYLLTNYPKHSTLRAQLLTYISNASMQLFQGSLGTTNNVIPGNLTSPVQTVPAHGLSAELTVLSDMNSSMLPSSYNTRLPSASSRLSVSIPESHCGQSLSSCSSTRSTASSPFTLDHSQNSGFSIYQPTRDTLASVQRPPSNDTAMSEVWRPWAK